MQTKTQIALIGGARKVIAVACSAIGAGQLVDDWTDWFWICLFFAAQWALHYAIEDTLRADVDDKEREYLGSSATVSAGPVAAPPSIAGAPALASVAVQTKQDPPIQLQPDPISTIHTIFWSSPTPSTSVLPDDQEDEDKEEENAPDNEAFLQAKMRREDLISALRNMQMGNKQLCTEIAQHVMQENPEGSLEDLIRKALQLYRRK
jgi:hypothetical protein